MTTPLTRCSAVELARRIREGELRAVEVVEAHIQAIEAVNPQLNAIVATRYDAARAEAEAADARLRAEGPEAAPPLLGVPCTIKECFALTGMPNSAGLVSRRGLIATHDATAVARVRAAGAIPLGVSNLSELCMWMESNNYVYGRSNNPYDPSRTVGGSSGGEGAIVGAGASPFGLGSDIGGSIRMPAFFNGVFGHKATGGLVPGTGQHPMAHGAARRYLATGPLCRKAEDLHPLLTLLAGPDGVDDCIQIPVRDPATVSLAGRRLILVDGNGAQAVSGELRDAQERAAQALVARGMTLERRRFPALKHSFEIWSSALMTAGGPSFAELMGEGEAVSGVWELMRWSVGRSPHTAMASLLACTEVVTGWFPGRSASMIALGQALKAELNEAMGPEGLLLYPSFPTVAPRHNTPFLRQLLLRFDYAYTAILNIMELPVTQAPLGLSGEGLPLGVQVVAPWGEDHVSIAAALALEQDLGGWVHPEDAVPLEAQ